MLYYFFEYLNKTMHIPGTGVFQYITFRSALAIILSLMLSTIYGKRIIAFLRNQQVGETVRELGLAGQKRKSRNANHGWINHHLRDIDSGFFIDQTQQHLHHSA